MGKAGPGNIRRLRNKMGSNRKGLAKGRQGTMKRRRLSNRNRVGANENKASAVLRGQTRKPGGLPNRKVGGTAKKRVSKQASPLSSRKVMALKRRRQQRLRAGAVKRSGAKHGSLAKSNVRSRALEGQGAGTNAVSNNENDLEPGSDATRHDKKGKRLKVVQRKAASHKVGKASKASQRAKAARSGGSTGAAGKSKGNVRPSGNAAKKSGDKEVGSERSQLHKDKLQVF